MNIVSLRLARPALPDLLRLRKGADDRPSPGIGRYAHRSWVRRHRALCFAALTLFAIIYGFAFAILSQVLLVQLTAPLVLLAGVALWVVPDIGRAPTRALAWWTNAFVIALLCWPDYIALALPGLPWITAVRLTSYPMTILLLVCLSSSSAFRREVADVLRTSSWLSRLVIGFTILSGLSILLSVNPFFSINRYIVFVTACISSFFVACWYFRREGRLERFAYLLWYISLFCCAIGLYEARYSKLPWAGRIPSILRIEDENILRILAGIARAFTGVYRVQSKFSVSLSFGEFLGISTPFILHLMVSSRSLAVRILTAASLPVIFYIVIKTDSRLAAISFFSSVLLYGFYWGFALWRRDRRSLIGPAVTLAYPAVLLAFVALSFIWRRLEVMVWGGGAAQSSTDARKAMYEMGVPMVLHNPVGHGIGMGMTTLGYTSPDGELTIDTYYLNAALEFGVVGLAMFFAIFALAAAKAGWIGMRTKNAELMFAVPACIALVNFLISKTVLAQQENHPLAFMLVGLVMAVAWRDQQ